MTIILTCSKICKRLKCWTISLLQLACVKETCVGRAPTPALGPMAHFDPNLVVFVSQKHQKEENNSSVHQCNSMTSPASFNNLGILLLSRNTKATLCFVDSVLTRSVGFRHLLWVAAVSKWPPRSASHASHFQQCFHTLCWFGDEMKTALKTGFLTEQ